MLMQLGQIFSQVLREVIPAGLDIGRQFLARELSRDSRRAERQAIQRLQASQGLSTPSAFDLEGGAFSPPFSRTVAAAQPASFPITSLPAGPRGLPMPLPFAGPTRFAGLNGTGAPRATPFAASFQERFVLDTQSGCLRAVMPGEKGNFRLDPRTGDFVRVKPRRMNVLNISAFKRAERRVNGLTKICRTLFTEERRQKTAKVRRKRRK